MTENEALVVGGGPAGIAAACTIAESNRSVLLCDQFPALGGAVHRSGGDGSKSISPPGDLKKSWGDLRRRLDRCASRVEIRLGTAFVGLDADGIAVLKDHKTNAAWAMRPRMAVFATGAHESVRPIPGWHLPGVTTVGGLQVNLKSAGTAPDCRILLAGSGPLLLAVAAQLTRLGTAPIAVVERSSPLRRPWRAIGVPAGYVSEAAGYLSVLASRRIRWLRGAEIRDISRRRDGLEVTVETRGKPLTFHADIVCLHDGLERNNIGLPAVNLDRSAGVLVEHAGDCRDLLGARAAPVSGDLAARSLLAAADGAAHGTFESGALLAERRAQRLVLSVFQPDTPATLCGLDDDTILCRCEQKTVGDLRNLLSSGDVSTREMKLLGRFGMGRCQGRFCCKWASALAQELGRIDDRALEMARQRWPLRPISVGALADIRVGFDAVGAADPLTNQNEER